MNRIIPRPLVTPNGDIWVAYVEFKHHPDHDKLRAPFKEPPKDLSPLIAPAKGDQILVKRFSGNRWECADCHHAAGRRSLSAGDRGGWLGPAVGVLVRQPEEAISICGRG
jgi:hypothetical protein